MNTYRDITYMCMDLLKTVSDDSYYTVDHILYLIDKYRIFLLKKNYSDIKKDIPESNYQTINIALDTTASTSAPYYKKSTDAVPEISNIGSLRAYANSSYLESDGKVIVTKPERLIFVGNNKWLKSFIYCAIEPDNKLKVKSASALTNVSSIGLTGIFESSILASDKDITTTQGSDILDRQLPLEEDLIPQVVELVVKELTGASYKPQDLQNNATDDFSDLMSYIRRNLKQDLLKQIEG